MKREMPFVSNEPDNLHCVQASYMMIAKYFDPVFAIPMEEWSKLTGFEEGKASWASAGLGWFKDHGYKVKHLSQFNYPRFVTEGGKYLIDLCGEEVGNWQIEYSNMPLEIERARQLLSQGIIVQREPLQQDIRQFIDDGYLVRSLVNGRRLNGQSGYFGHALVIFDYDDAGIYMHDPGLPPRANRHVSWDDFEAAWADPNTESKEMDAIKLAA